MTDTISHDYCHAVRMITKKRQRYQYSTAKWKAQVKTNKIYEVTLPYAQRHKIREERN